MLLQHSSNLSCRLRPHTLTWPQGGLADDGSSALQVAPEGWRPAVGDTVRVLKMGGASGQVVSAAARGGGKVGVRVGSLTVELRLADLAPAGGAASGSSTRATPRARKGKGRAGSGRGSDSDGSSAGSLKAAAQQLRARGALKGGSVGDDGEGGPSTRVAIQTSHNPVDVRGMPADEAALEVQAAVLSAPAGLALFVVHGVGTGRVRAEVLRALRRMPQVARLETEERSAGGCTVVSVK